MALPNVTYGFIGLGVMGYGMARNLRSKMPPSSTLFVCEINEPRRNQFISETEGLVKVLSSPCEVAEKADIIFTMLPKGQHVLDVFTNAKTGLLKACSGETKKLFLECSTIDVKTCLQVASAVESSGLGDYVDSPVSGGPNGAVGGTLTFMVGGSDELFTQVKPIVSTMGREQNIFHCGPIGAGLATKQINNYLSAVSLIGVCEAMNTGMRYGLDAHVLASVINVSTGKCYNSVENNPVKGVSPNSAANKDFEGGFSVELCKGVIDMAVQLGKDVGAKSVLGDVVANVLQTATESPNTKGKDYRVIYKLFAEDDDKALEAGTA